MQKREEVDCFFQKLSFAKGVDEEKEERRL